MIDRLLFALNLLSALGCGLVAGIFFAFSTFVMRALGKLPPAQGMDAMKSINVVVINPWFLTAFFGTAAMCVLVMVLSLLRWHDPGAAHLLLGSLLYLLGTVLVTIVFNVPRNNALKAVVSASAEGTRLWADYLNTWTAWNHVRTVAALAASVSLTLALCH
ncbi:MAG: DUF1772 domain-containing protein [Gammaproteobacteria bacterium]